MFMRIISLAILALFALPLTSFSLEYTIRPSLQLGQAYNDNIDLSSGNRVGDFITSLTPGIDFAARSERLHLALNYSPFFLRYISHNERDNVSHQASARATLTASDQWSFNLAHAFVQTEDAGVIRAVEGAGPITDARNRLTNNTTTGTITFKATQRLSLNLDGTYSVSKNSRTGLSDVNAASVGFGAQYRFTERTSLMARTRETFYEYQTTGNARTDDYLFGVRNVSMILRHLSFAFSVLSPRSPGPALVC